MSTHGSALSPGKGCLRRFKLYSSSTLYFQEASQVVWTGFIVFTELIACYTLLKNVPIGLDFIWGAFNLFYENALNFSKHGCLLTLLLHVFLGQQTPLGPDCVHNCLMNTVVKKWSNRRIICRCMTKVPILPGFFLGHPECTYNVFICNFNGLKRGCTTCFIVV